MNEVDGLIRRARKTRHGFSDLQKAAEEVVSAHKRADSLRLAKQLFESEAPQARMVAAFILGRLAAHSRPAMSFLRTHVSEDPDWRVQEVLAKAFDRYCSEIGYERALPAIRNWLGDSRANARRAVSEGLRIWTARPYFREHPAVAVQLLSQLKDDPSEYVRRSVGNALRDISRRHLALVAAELRGWDTSKSGVAQTYGLASMFLELD